MVFIAASVLILLFIMCVFVTISEWNNYDSKLLQYGSHIHRPHINKCVAYILYEIKVVGGQQVVILELISGETLMMDIDKLSDS